MNVSIAQQLLTDAGELPKNESARLQRGLLVTAAIREVVSHEPVLVGGSAEDFYTPDEYHPTDVDLCGWLTPDEEELLVQLGFERVGRHWYHRGANVAVEFPENRIAGDESRIKRVPIGSGVAPIIGVEDLYLDRLRQSSSDPYNDSYIQSATAIAAANLPQIDWTYVERQLRREERDQGSIGKHMRKQHSKIVRRLRQPP